MVKLAERVREIVGSPYSDVCVTGSCPNRTQPSFDLVIRRLIHRFLGLAYFAFICIFVGSLLGLRLHGQQPPLPSTQVIITSMRVDAIVEQLKDLEIRVRHSESEISTMEGLGIGISAVLGGLSAIQLLFKK